MSKTDEKSVANDGIIVGLDIGMSYVPKPNVMQNGIPTNGLWRDTDTRRWRISCGVMVMEM